MDLPSAWTFFFPFFFARIFFLCIFPCMNFFLVFSPPTPPPPPITFLIVRPLSDLISWTWPLLAMNLRSAIRKESVSKLWATSRCTARIAIHVKMTPYRFRRLRPRRTCRGPKQSIPTAVKGGAPGLIRSIGRSAIFCSQSGPCRRLQLKHLERTLLTTELFPKTGLVIILTSRSTNATRSLNSTGLACTSMMSSAVLRHLSLRLYGSLNTNFWMFPGWSNFDT